MTRFKDITEELAELDAKLDHTQLLDGELSSAGWDGFDSFLTDHQDEVAVLVNARITWVVR